MELIKLISALTLPILIPIAAVFLFARFFFKEKTSIINFYSLTPNKSLLHQPTFWISIFIPISYFIGFGLISWQGYALSVTSGGIKEFLSISTLPLTLLSTAIPAAAIVASFHSTEQTAAQIRITSYYAHKNDFYSYFEKLGERNYLDSFTARHNAHPLLYLIYFKGTPEDGTPRFNIEKFKSFEEKLSSARKFIHQIFNETDDNLVTLVYLDEICPLMRSLMWEFSLSKIDADLSERSVIYYWNGIERKTIGNCAADLIAVYRYALSLYMDICAASGYKSNNFTLFVKSISYFDYTDEFLKMAGTRHIERIHKEEIKKMRLPTP